MKSTFSGVNVIFYDHVKNFGDWVNSEYWKHAFGTIENADSLPTILGIGTILNDTHILGQPVRDILVAGSGYGYGTITQKPSSLSIGFVRGPLTCDALKISRKYGIGDPAYICKEVLGLNASTTAKHDQISFIPHFESLYFYPWELICRLSGINLISPLDTFRNVFNLIANSTLVITESLHGAIIADSLRIPYVPVKTREEINEFKWQDFFCSLNINSHLNALSPPSPGKAGILNYSTAIKSIRQLKYVASLKPTLSSDQSNKDMKSKLYDAINSIHRSYLTRDFSPYLCKTSTSL